MQAETHYCDEIEELGSNAEHKARGLNDVEGEGDIQLDQAVLLTRMNAMIPDNQPPAKVCPSLAEFWWSLLPNGYHIISMNPDGTASFAVSWIN
jgi:hypothetical protein